MHATKSATSVALGVDTFLPSCSESTLLPYPLLLCLSISLSEKLSSIPYCWFRSPADVLESRGSRSPPSFPKEHRNKKRKCEKQTSSPEVRSTLRQSPYLGQMWTHFT